MNTIGEIFEKPIDRTIEEVIKVDQINETAVRTELEEYVAPQTLNLKNSLVLATQLFAVSNKESVWGIELESRFARDFDQGPDYSLIVDEAKAIAGQLSRAGLIGQ